MSYTFFESVYNFVRAKNRIEHENAFGISMTHKLKRNTRD